MTRRYVTTPIYYVNSRPHIGHAYTTILCDAVARWGRLSGQKTFFLTGTDEHGQKVQQAADERGLTPIEHCDEMQQAFRDLWPRLEIQHDGFIRTTEKRHERVVQAALQQLWEADLIYPKEYGGWYSVGEERFFGEKDLVDGKDPISGTTVEWVEERNYFFRMSRFQAPLVEHIEKNPDFIRPENRRNEVLGFLRQPLEDLCISRPRSRLAWGIPIPFDPDYVTYVWFDALLNYLTGIGWPDTLDWPLWWEGATHVLGKDILTTHSVYWTTMLLALGVPLPHGLVAHGWWLLDDSKMSKSKGNVVRPLDLVEKYGAAPFRYFVLRDMSVGQDANFSEVALVGRNNSELSNDLGNLVNRVLNLVEKRFGGRVPPDDAPDPTVDGPLRAEIAALPETVASLVDGFRVNQAIEACMSLVRQLNKYVTETAPFKLVVSAPDRAASIVRLVLDGLAAVAQQLTPVMPEAMADLTGRLGAADGAVVTGAQVRKGEPLFPRFDPPVFDEPATAGGEETSVDEKPSPKTGSAGLVEYADFAKLDLRVAQVVAAEPVEGADKLLRLTLDVGDSERHVVAGIAPSYGPENVIGKRVVLVANLKPRTIFGVESQGMILAAHDQDRLFVLTPDGYATSGVKVS